MQTVVYIWLCTCRKDCKRRRAGLRYWQTLSWINRGFTTLFVWRVSLYTDTHCCPSSYALLAQYSQGEEGLSSQKIWGKVQTTFVVTARVRHEPQLSESCHVICFLFLFFFFITLCKLQIKSPVSGLDTSEGLEWQLWEVQITPGIFPVLIPLQVGEDDKTSGDDSKTGMTWAQPFCPCSGTLAAGIRIKVFAHWHPVTTGSNRSRDPVTLDGRLPFHGQSKGITSFHISLRRSEEGPLCLALLFSVCLPSEFVSAQRKDQRLALTNTSNLLSSRVSHAVVEASGSDLCIPLNKKILA